MRVAAKLSIPFLTCDAEEEYKSGVADYFISEYAHGRTPNPDVMCNQKVKFGAFLEFARNKGADYIATGHYAQNITNELHRGVDNNKDQSYFLWVLTNEQLSHTLLPVGDSEKAQIRKEAEEAGLLTASKQDSQGICFLGHVDIPEFLSHYIELSPGVVLDTDGNPIGEHKGALVYTLGQRHGFTVNNHDPERSILYVQARDLSQNTITVGPTKPEAQRESEITLYQLNLRQSVAVNSILEAQFRYRQNPFRVEVIAIDDSKLTLKVLDTVEQPAPGQSCVLYDSSLSLGGGIIL
jgi:tRNA-specific 2-thiouridylase